MEGERLYTGKCTEGKEILELTYTAQSHLTGHCLFLPRR
mgnify:CR=1 FL=1